MCCVASVCSRLKSNRERESDDPEVSPPSLSVVFGVPKITAAGGLLSRSGSEVVFFDPFDLWSNCLEGSWPSLAADSHCFPGGWLAPVVACAAVPVDRSRVVERLVRARGVVSLEVHTKPPVGREPVTVVIEVDVLILHAAPQPLDEPVVDPPARSSMLTSTPADCTASMNPGLVSCEP